MSRWFGTDGGSFYNFYSGLFGVLVFATGLFWTATVNYRKANCKRQWCWRLGHHKFTDPDSGTERLLCWRHHPDVHHKNLTAGRIEEIQKQRHLYFGDKPGKG